MKKFIKLMLVATLAMALSSCGGQDEPVSTEDQTVIDNQDSENMEESETTEEPENSNEDALEDGLYFAETNDFDKNGYKTTATVTVENGAISEVIIDAYNEEGITKREAVESGDYDMSIAGAEKTWTEQADLFAEYLIASQEISLELDDEGKTDTISGVTITVDSYIDLVNEALTSLPMEIETDETTEKTAEFATLTPGSYTVEGDSFDSNSGYKDQLTLVVDENGAISEVIIDAYNEEGITKREAVESGDYDMSIAGAEKTWTEQADLFAEYIVENQSYGVAMDDTGKTDAVSGVTISVRGYVRLLDDAITLAEQ